MISFSTAKLFQVQENELEAIPTHELHISRITSSILISNSIVLLKNKDSLTFVMQVKF